MKTSSSALRPARGPGAVFAVLMAPLIAQAHTGVGHTHGFLAGVAHPVFGFDHVCAMVAVGLWAAQRGGRATWVVPATFVAVMALGGALGMAGMPLPLVEPGIVASVLILGLLTAAAVRLPVAASAGVVGVFAIFHGFAHGAEMPAHASGLTYGAGFMLATAALHLAGIGLGWAMTTFGREQLVRVAGGAIVACGAALCLL